jgi:ubiquinone/menaquinone biosynthesis C-methylase UbiE
MKMDRRSHWDAVFEQKPLETLSWYQLVPETSLQLIRSLSLSPDARMLDVGGGDSLLVDHLLAEGYQQLTLLDISARALERSRRRLGTTAKTVEWVQSDILQYQTDHRFDCWHDRAAFHFFTDPEDIRLYVEKAAAFIKPGGYLIIGTFSENGPERCSGLPVQRYSETPMKMVFAKDFEPVNCVHADHTTPAGQPQSFLFCLFKRL